MKREKSRQKMGITTHRQRWLILGSCLAVLLVTLGILGVSNAAQGPKEAPEAEAIMAAQEGLPFQILIPSYLPAGFERGKAAITISESGPGGEPTIEVTYRTRQGGVLHMLQWIPVNPDKEILNGSRPIQTKWGKGWSLQQTDTLICTWVDIGPLRVSLYTPDLNLISREQLVQIAESMGPASGRQVFTYLPEKPIYREMPPPPAFEVKTNEEGIQEFNLIITPGGYSPMRFAVKKGVPVRINFRQLGQVGCGKVLMFPNNDGSFASITLESETDKKVLEFTPETVGDTNFHCGENMFRGIMTVRE